MSDTLQFVESVATLTLKKQRQPNVRYASACRDVPQIHLLSKDQ
jgi:hypothetical protein